MKNFGRIALVSLIVFSLVMAQNNVLLAQNVSPVVKYVGPESFGVTLQKANAASTSPLLAPTSIATLFPPSAPNANLPTTPPAVPPQAAAARSSSSSGSRGTPYGLIVGLAMVGAGVGILAAGEPTHQTVCLTYGICPVPGAVHVFGGLLIGVGAPLAITKLLKH
jgi:hypothetical protein